jgi:hypothetical protein
LTDDRIEGWRLWDAGIPVVFNRGIAPMHIGNQGAAGRNTHLGRGCGVRLPDRDEAGSWFTIHMWQGEFWDLWVPLIQPERFPILIYYQRRSVR